MSEFRQNRATKEWVIIAPERGKRPSDLAKDIVKRELLPSYSENCPFCPGHEEQTPPAVFQVPAAGNWKLRVVPNRFAALSPEKPAARNFVGTFLSANGFGIAEVIIESPLHNKTIATMSREELGTLYTKLELPAHLVDIDYLRNQALLKSCYELGHRLAEKRKAADLRK